MNYKELYNQQSLDFTDITKKFNKRLDKLIEDMLDDAGSGSVKPFYDFSMPMADKFFANGKINELIDAKMAEAGITGYAANASLLSVRGGFLTVEIRPAV